MDDINSWIGLPEGPDCIGGKLKFSYVKYDTFEADVSWKFTSHGENGFGLFNQKNENGYYDYFPSVKEKHAKTEEEKKNALESAENLGLHGVVSYKNVISFGGTYVLNRFVSLSGKIDDSFIFNHNNIQDNFQHGAEFDLSCTCKLF